MNKPRRHRTGRRTRRLTRSLLRRTSGNASKSWPRRESKSDDCEGSNYVLQYRTCVISYRGLLDGSRCGDYPAGTGQASTRQRLRTIFSITATTCANPRAAQRQIEVMKASVESDISLRIGQSGSTGVVMNLRSRFVLYGYCIAHRSILLSIANSHSAILHARCYYSGLRWAKWQGPAAPKSEPVAGPHLVVMIRSVGRSAMRSLCVCANGTSCVSSQ